MVTTTPNITITNQDQNFTKPHFKIHKTHIKKYQILKKQDVGMSRLMILGKTHKAIRKKKQVFLEGYVLETNDEQDLVRAKSLADDDLEELKRCLDLGFGFNYDEIPELCNTLPALELCYSMSQKYLDNHQKSPESSSSGSESLSSPASGGGGKANWKISSPGDDPEDVKARLKFWAQAVACTVKLCS